VLRELLLLLLLALAVLAVFLLLFLLFSSLLGLRDLPGSPGLPLGAAIDANPSLRLSSDPIALSLPPAGTAELPLVVRSCDCCEYCECDDAWLGARESPSKLSLGGV
jgi:hypothetical protein